jgi:RNA polymerase sigma-70 factor (ECF subfamily)
MPPTLQPLDEHSFKSLFTDHFTGLCQFASGYIKDSEAAREIVQDAFVNLWLKRDTIDSSKPVKSYLSTSVRNRCINYLRDHKKFSSDLLALENLSNESMYEQPDALVESDLAGQIDRAIEELPEKCRQIFRLSRYQNLKYQQIADQLQISVKTVETQMSKALQHMRHRLAEYLPLFILLFSLPRYLATSPFDFFAISLFRYFAISFPMASG